MKATKVVAAFATALVLAGTAASAAPDLTFTSVTTRHVAYRRGAPIVVNFTLRNIGNQVSSNPVLSIRLSTDNVITLGDLRLGEKLYAALAPNGTLEQVISGAFPAHTPPGTYFVGMYALSLADGNAANNGVIDPVQVQVYCPGDTNGDQTINFADLNTVLSQFGQSDGSFTGDVNGDFKVDFADLNLVLSNFGNTGC